MVDSRWVIDERGGGYRTLVARRDPIGEVGQGEIILFAKTQVSSFLKVAVGRNRNADATKIGFVLHP